MSAAPLVVAFRVDASEFIGSGHVMRCITLALEFCKQVNAQIHFITREHVGHLNEFILSSGFVLHSMPSGKKKSEASNECTNQHESWLDATWEEDCEATKNILLSINCNLLIIDHYAIDNRWESCLKDSYTGILCVLDDLADRNHDAHFLVDYTLGRKESHYVNLVDQNCKLLMGLSFAILRQEFLSKAVIKNTVSSDKINILVSMGGVDQNNFTLKVIKLVQDIRSIKRIKLNIIVGSSYKQFDELELFLSNQKFEYELKKNTNNMVGYMNSSDFAISSIGTTTWELFSQGVPSILIPIANNQLAHAKQIHMNSLGYVIFENFENNLRKFVHKFINDPISRRELSHRTTKLVDGQGAQRVVLELLSALKL